MAMDADNEALAQLAETVGTTLRANEAVTAREEVMFQDDPEAIDHWGAYDAETATLAEGTRGGIGAYDAETAFCTNDAVPA